MKGNLSLDLIRAVAITLVMVYHVFKLGDMSMPQAGVRCFSMVCNPLFLMLTGYLNNNKTFEDYFDKGKWRGCIRILLAYVMLGSVCYVAGNFLDGKGVSLKEFLLKLLSFRLTPYGWYIEMWIGLFFLTPFLNMIACQLTDKSLKCFIAVLLFFTCIASFFNRNGMVVLPNFWISLYPVTYYFLGYFIAKHNVRIPSLLAISYCVFVVVGEPLLNYILHTNSYLYFWGGFDTIVYALLAFMLFALMKNAKLQNVKSGGVIARLSRVSLYMYLISYVFDHFWYTTFKREFFTNEPIFNFPYYFIIFGLSFMCTFCASYLYVKFEDAIFKRKK